MSIVSIEVKIAKIADNSLYIAMLSIVQDRGFMSCPELCRLCFYKFEISLLCNTNGLIFQVGVRITLASHGLTKIIVFTPYYVVLNEAPVSIEFYMIQKYRKNL